MYAVQKEKPSRLWAAFYVFISSSSFESSRPLLDLYITASYKYWKVARLLFQTGLHQFVIENCFPRPCFLNVLDTTVAVGRLALRSSGCGTSWPDAGSTMRMRPWTACRSSGVIHPECSRQTIWWNCRYWLLCFEKNRF